MKFKIQYLFLGLLLSLSASAQLIDYVQVYAGTRLFSQDNSKDAETGLPNNFYANFSPGQTIGASVYRQVLDKVCVGASFEVGNALKPNYNLNSATIGLNAKYNFNNIESFISPYLMGGLNYSFVSVRQSNFTDGPITLSNPSQTEPEKIYTQIVTYRNPETNILFVPVYGFHAGAGLEFKIREGWGLYVEYKFSYSFTKNAPVLQNEYDYNKSNLLYHNIFFGIRYFL